MPIATLVQEYCSTSIFDYGILCKCRMLKMLLNKNGVTFFTSRCSKPSGPAAKPFLLSLSASFTSLVVIRPYDSRLNTSYVGLIRVLSCRVLFSSLSTYSYCTSSNLGLISFSGAFMKVPSSILSTASFIFSLQHY